jgi:putative FmdB family regulatory protein
MPLYSYHCAECDKDVELLISADDTPACPNCGNPDMERLMSRVAPPGKSRGIIKSARAQAAREGHLSNFSRSERQGRRK